MKSAAVALALSLAVHGLLAAALAIYLTHAPQPTVLATLDLSSVELSLADEDAENAAALPAASADQAPAHAAKQPTDEPPPAVDESAAPRPPEPKDTPTVDAPELPPAEMQTPPKPTAKPQPSTAAPAPRQARIDAPPRPRRTIRPDYPRGARARGEQGHVVLEIRVAADGTVSEVTVAVSSGFTELDAAAVKAARAARFTPAESEGRAVSATARLTLEFKLR